MAGRPCKICADSEKARIAAQMITQGATDEAVATAVGGVSRVSVHRHRVNHIQPLARAVADAVGKGMPARKEREKALAAAERCRARAWITLWPSLRFRSTARLRLLRLKAAKNPAPFLTARR